MTAPDNTAELPPRANTAPGHVVVIGGGLAGITAAIALSEGGSRVTLLEARPRLGGATCSFSRGGLTIDNGQHVFLRCCTAYRGLLARLGMTGAVSLQDRFDVTVLSPFGRAQLRRSALPAPLHLAAALARYEHLAPVQRLRAVGAALALARLDPARPALDAQPLGAWLARHGQDDRARRVLWDLFTVSSLNVPGDEGSLALAATVVKTALLSARDAADIGVPTVPLGDLHGRAAAALLARLGASVRLGAKVAALDMLPGGGFRVALASRPRLGGAPSPEPGGNASPGPGHGEPGRGDDGGIAVIHADAVVLAVPHEVAARLAPSAAFPGRRAMGGAAPGRGWARLARGERLPSREGGPYRDGGPGPAQWRQLGTAPIVNVHVIYDRRVTRLPFAAAVDSPVQWVFDRTGPSGLRSGQYLAVSLSAADGWVDVPAARLKDIFLPAMADLFPAVADARVTDFFVTRERRATLRQVPGCGRLRPSAATALPGLVLAGAWTDTGWPDTMEGAVRSGLYAARELRQGQRAAWGSPGWGRLVIPGWRPGAVAEASA